MSKKLYTADELRNKWIEFFKAKGHVDVGSASLIPENDPSVLFTTAGMHPLVPFLLGTPHLAGKRLCNVQKCIRTNDIDEVGDNCHLTFFEMMGNWSLGDYFKKEKTAWSYEFMTKELGLDPKKIETTLFEGDDSAPKDVISEAFLKDLGFDDKRIHFNPKEDNWWGLGQDNTPCGPDNEWFYPDAKGKLVEIGNDVYMQYVQYDGGKFKEKDSKCVDTGFGLERNLAFLNGATSAYVTELFSGVIAKLEELSGKKYYDIQEDEYTKSFRIVADHTRAATAILGDVRAIVPANGGAGYVLRRLIRKSVRHIRRLGVLEPQKIGEIALIYCEFFKNAYPEFWENREFIVSEFNKEEERFLKTLEGGEKEFDKLINGIERKAEFLKKQGSTEVVEKIITGKAAFRLYDTFGFPIEVTEEIARERGYTVDRLGYEEEYKAHQDLSRTANEGQFKGGLSSYGKTETNYHTATHLLHAALSKTLNSECKQSGSNITPERMRFDFTFDRKLTSEEVKTVEDLVNAQIAAAIPVILSETSVKDAKDSGAIGVFDSKYGDVVKVYTIGGFSKEICGGPHAANTADLGHFRILKEEASSAGVRRIKAVLE